MAALRFALPASALLVLGLCWLANADADADADPTTTPKPLSPGFVTKYITPMANISLEKLVGRWFVAEGVPRQEVPLEIRGSLCMIVDFRYDENGTLEVEPKSLLDGLRSSPLYAYPVDENGVWDVIYYGVSGEGVLSHSDAVVHVDDRFLVVAACSGDSAGKCGAYVAVRDVADADRREQLQEMRRRMAAAGVQAAGGPSQAVIQPCRAVAPQLSAGQEVPSAL